MKKRRVIWLVLACYALTLCGNLWETGCHHDESGLAIADQESQVHLHSAVRVAAHGLLHAVACADDGFVVSPHRCCVSQANDEIGMLRYTGTRQWSWNAHSGSAKSCGLSALPGEPMTSSRIGSVAFSVDVRIPLALETVQATVLLI